MSPDAQVTVSPCGHRGLLSQRNTCHSRGGPATEKLDEKLWPAPLPVPQWTEVCVPSVVSVSAVEVCSPCY